MLDPKDATDAWISLAEAARLCPSARSGKNAHPSAIMRWGTKGVQLKNGTVHKLQLWRFPGAWMTTRAALNEFIDGLTCDHQGAPVTIAPPRLPLARQRAIEKAERELSAVGI